MGVMDALAKTLIAAGLILAVIGVAILVGHKMGFLGLGRLPGDIRIEREHMNIYIPLTTSILISIVLSVVLYLLSRLR